jgi:anti-sigma factor RsiW
MEHLTEAELQAWVDREIDSEERARVSRHLEGCDVCRRAAGELRGAGERFSAAMLRYDDDLAAEAGGPRRLLVAPVRRRARPGHSMSVPRWAGRAAALVLLFGAAAAAAMVPGSPLRALLFDRPADVVAPGPLPADVRPVSSAVVNGASITVRPPDGRLTVRITDFAPETRIVVALVDRAVAVANLPDGAQNARFVVASGTLEVIGAGVPAGELGGVVRVALPRSLQTGVVELDGTVVARVSDRRMTTWRQVSRTGDEAVFEVGG